MKVDLKLTALLSVFCSSIVGCSSDGSGGPQDGDSQLNTSGDCNTTSVASCFGSDWYFNQSIASASLASNSADIISNLNSRGGWGNSNIFQIDFSIDVYYATSSATRVPFRDGGMYSPDSDVPSDIPIHPSTAAGFESSSGRVCDGGDCHYIVVDTPNNKLIEVFVGGMSGGVFEGSGSLAIWDYKKQYPANFRGDVCTSADAGGLPIAPMLFTPEEVAAGEIKHAIRFILPNPRIQNKVYVRPATHGTGGASWAQSHGVPYGARFRLKSSFNVESLPSEGAKVVARALQKYGMILADGGQIALTAKSDAHSQIKWEGLLAPRALQALKVTDFEVIDAGPEISFDDYNCVRTQ